MRKILILSILETYPEPLLYGHFEIYSKNQNNVWENKAFSTNIETRLAFRAWDEWII